MNVMLVEPSGGGHHMALYVRHVARKLVESGITISLLTTRSAVAHPSYELVDSEIGNSVKLHFLPEFPKNNKFSNITLIITQLKIWLILRYEFAKIAKETHPFDVVYVPTLDWIAKAIELVGSPFGKTPFVVLYMSPKHHRKKMGLGPESRHDWLYEFCFQRLLRIKTLRSVLVIDEYFFEYCKKRYGSLSKKVKFVPDFGELHGSVTKSGARAVLGIGSGKKVILVYGSLTKRKGIVQLVDAFLASPVSDDLVLLLAGKPDEQIEAMMKTRRMSQLVESGRIVVLSRFQTEKEEQLVFVASDYAWLGYVSGFYGSSGVLYQAGSIGLPVIAMKDGLIGKLVERYSLGILIDPHNKNSIVEALLQAAICDSRIIINPETQIFLKLHTPESHASSVLTILKSMT